MKNTNNAREQSNSLERGKGRVRRGSKLVHVLAGLIVRPITKSLEKTRNEIIKHIQSLEDSIEIIAREIESQKKVKST